MKTISIMMVLTMWPLSLANAEVELGDGLKLLEPEIIQYIEKRSAAYGVKYAYVSNVVRGDIDGDEKRDVFVSYTIEGIGGGNFSLMYQVLFLNKHDKMIFKVERSNGSIGTAQGKSYRPIKIVPGKIICETLQYSSNDGVCCPSIKGTGEIIYKDGKLVVSNRKK